MQSSGEYVESSGQSDRRIPDSNYATFHRSIRGHLILTHGASQRTVDNVLLPKFIPLIVTVHKHLQGSPETVAQETAKWIKGYVA